MRFSVVVGLVAPCCLVAACGSAGSGSGSLSSGSLSGESALEILALTTTAITANGFSFHFIDVSRVGLKTTTLTGTDTAAGSEQTLSGSVPALTVERRSDGTVFVRGAAEALQSALGLSQTTATSNAGKWIELQSGDTPYSAVTAALGPKQELDAFVPVAPYVLDAPQHYHGRTVVGVSGKARASAGNGTGHVVTLYVPTEPPYTPVGATLTFGTGSGAGVEAVIFNSWGQRIDPPVPTAAVSFSSLG
jgi:hypothetical protein